MPWPDIQDDDVCDGEFAADLLDEIMERADELLEDTGNEKWHSVWGAAFQCKANKKHGKHKASTMTTAKLLETVCEAYELIVKANPKVSKVLNAIQHKS